MEKSSLPLQLKLINLINETLENKDKVKFNVHGNSMTPFLKNRDVITIKAYQVSKPVRFGDIVAVNIKDEKIFVHRVVGTKGRKILLKGDNCPDCDGLFDKNKILGIVIALERSGIKQLHLRSINCIVAFLSRSGVLNRILLPFLRHIKLKLLGT